MRGGDSPFSFFLPFPFSFLSVGLPDGRWDGVLPLSKTFERDSITRRRVLFFLLFPLFFLVRQESGRLSSADPESRAD